jgi:SAM-dependent methyltransferase
VSAPVERLSPVRAQPFPDEWYDASEASHFWFRWRLAVLRHALRAAGADTAGAARVLDVGCGSGVLAGQLEDATGWTVDGTDLNLPALERCRPRRGRALYYDVTEERADLLGSYDVVVLFDVLEHLAAPRALAAAAVRHLRPGGLFLVNVPALPSLFSAYDRAAGHLRRYTAASLDGELGGLGLSRADLRYWGFSLLPLVLARKALLARGGPRTIERGFRPPLPGVNAALVGLMRAELALLRAPPLGTSVMYVGRREVRGAPV